VLALLLTFEDDTLISTADLPQHGTEGRDAIRTALAELREFGYVQQTRYSYIDDHNRVLWAWETTIGDVPLPSPENPSSVPENPSSEMGVVTTPATRRENTSDTPELSTITEDGFSGFLTTNLTTTNSNSLLDTSYLESTLTAGDRPRGRRGWDQVPSGKPKRPTQRERAAAARAEEVSTDPFIALSDEPDPQPESTGSDDPIAEARQRIAARRSMRPVGPAENLARYFEMLASPQTADEPAGRFNRKALAKNLSAWRKQGTSDEQIRTMFETYWAPSFQRNLTVEAWKDFINQRAKIHGQTGKAIKAEEWEANRHNEAYWV